MKGRMLTGFAETFAIQSGFEYLYVSCYRATRYALTFDLVRDITALFVLSLLSYILRTFLPLCRWSFGIILP